MVTISFDHRGLLKSLLLAAQHADEAVRLEAVEAIQTALCRWWPGCLTEALGVIFVGRFVGDLWIFLGICGQLMVYFVAFVGVSVGFEGI
jgi:hypothetical protein